MTRSEVIQQGLGGSPEQAGAGLPFRRGDKEDRTS
jgi:hypothetical protein